MPPVKLDDSSENDDVVDARGQRPAGRAAQLGGGAAVAVIVVYVVARLFGVDVSGLFGGGTTSSSSSSQAPSSGSQGSAVHAQDPQIRRIGAMMRDIQNTFEGQFKTKGQAYRHAKLVVFTEEIDTGCGRSSAAIGPFYCPADEEAYIDLSFYQELTNRFGAPGEFAQAYVLAHEIGHHLQKLLGYESKARGFHADPHIRNEGSVRLELQADCFAGVWGHSANERKLLEVGEPEQALTAAASIGDDRLQKQAGVDVNSETWTHGSSQERVRWFKRGFDTGNLDACDTFSATSL